jgi:hypothetical protein
MLLHHYNSRDLGGSGKVFSPSVLDGVSQHYALKEGQNSSLEPIITFVSSPTIPTHLPIASASPPLNSLLTTRQPDSFPSSPQLEHSSSTLLHGLREPVEETSNLNWVHYSLIPFIKENKYVVKLTTYMGKRILEPGGSSEATSSYSFNQLKFLLSA